MIEQNEHVIEQNEHVIERKKNEAILCLRKCHDGAPFYADIAQLSVNPSPPARVSTHAQ